MTHSLRLERTLPATKKQVWSQISDASNICRWSGGAALFDVQHLGVFSLLDEWVKGNILKVKEGEIVMDWRCADWGDEWISSNVVWKVVEAGREESKLIIEHTMLPNEEECKKQECQWDDYFLTPLEDYLMILYNR